MIQARDEVPHFNVEDIDGTPVDYSGIWQRRNLVLVALRPGDPGEPACVSRLRAIERKLAELQTSLVITREPVRGVDAPGVIIADRWGEVAFATTAPRAHDLPDAGELVDWARHIQHQCPECQGEAR